MAPNNTIVNWPKNKSHRSRFFIPSVVNIWRGVTSLWYFHKKNRKEWWQPTVKMEGGDGTKRRVLSTFGTLTVLVPVAHFSGVKNPSPRHMSVEWLIYDIWFIATTKKKNIQYTGLIGSILSSFLHWHPCRTVAMVCCTSSEFIN